jgi:hypothetical protein
MAARARRRSPRSPEARATISPRLRAPCPPRRLAQVAKAVADQMFQLNTNSRYLSHGLVDFSQQLLDLLPKSLEVGDSEGAGPRERHPYTWGFFIFWSGGIKSSCAIYVRRMLMDSALDKATPCACLPCLPHAAAAR